MSEQQREFVPASGMSMREFLVANGWLQNGIYGCCETVSDRFTNAEFPNREIMVEQKVARMKIYHTYPNDRDKKIYKIGGIINFEHIYKEYIND